MKQPGQELMCAGALFAHLAQLMDPWLPVELYLKNNLAQINAVDMQKHPRTNITLPNV